MARALLTLEDVATFPRPGLGFPSCFQFTPDSSMVCFISTCEGFSGPQVVGARVDDAALADSARLGSGVAAVQRIVTVADALYTHKSLSREEELRMERQRQMAHGLSTFSWATSGSTGLQRCLIPLLGNVYVQDGLAGRLRPVHEDYTRGAPPAIDPRMSPDGDHVAFVLDNELYVAPADGSSPPLQITSGARGKEGVSNGLAEFIAQEELSRSEGYWWSPDSSRLAFAFVDESHIAAYPIVHQGKAQVGPNQIEEHRYPFAGQPNAVVQLGVVAATGGEPVWMRVGLEDDCYLGRVQFAPDGTLLVQTLDRRQAVLTLFACDTTTGEATVVLTESSPYWVDVNDLLVPLKTSPGFIWGSQRSGFLHLYAYDSIGAGARCRQLTDGECVVDEVAAVDEDRGLVFYIGSVVGDAMQRQLFAVSLTGGAPQRITGANGSHKVVFAPSNRAFIDIHSSLTSPLSAVVCSSLDGQALLPLHLNKDERVHRVHMPPPTPFCFPNRDGVTLMGLIYKPLAVWSAATGAATAPPDAGGGSASLAPLVVSVYGGPHVQTVVDAWHNTADLRAQYLAQRGVCVIKVDNRGSARRGVAFEGAIKHNMGDVELRDQEDGVRFVCQQGYADIRRVAIFGWSYGGYLAALALAKHADTFSVAVSGAPVTSWDGYDTCYTERYMGFPSENAAGYEQSSCLAHAAGVKGKLLLVHGLVDENVHFRHTARFINALIEARRPYDLMIFPDERHSARSVAVRAYLEERIVDYLRLHLGLTS